jgi:hypothetical protein
VAQIVLYDACVLYPAPLRDLLMQLALADQFQARWTDQIHGEWTRNVLADRPDITPASLARCRRLMDEPLIPTLTLPDPDDRHILAAAIHGEAEQIVTFNLGDFPASALGPTTSRPSTPTTSSSGPGRSRARPCSGRCGSIGRA